MSGGLTVSVLEPPQLVGVPQRAQVPDASPRGIAQQGKRVAWTLRDGQAAPVSPRERERQVDVAQHEEAGAAVVRPSALPRLGHLGHADRSTVAHAMVPTSSSGHGTGCCSGKGAHALEGYAVAPAGSREQVIS